MTATVSLTQTGHVARIQLNRPDADNAINGTMIAELGEALSACEGRSSIIVLEGRPDVFCTGADFHDYTDDAMAHGPSDPGALYDLWLRLAEGPYITVSHVQGRTMAGGVGFVAASDIVIAAESASFGLSELLFGLFPAMVMPFLVRRIGFQRANYLTLTTKPIGAPIAAAWGLVDECNARSEAALGRCLQRLSQIPTDAVVAYEVSRVAYIFLSSLIGIVVVLPGLFFLKGFDVDPARLLLFFVIGMIFCSCWGIIIGSILKNGSSSMGAAMMPFMLILAISGLIYPIMGLPRWLQGVAQVFPFYWEGLGIRSALLPNSAAAVELTQSWRPVLTYVVLAIWTGLGLILAPMSLRRITRRATGSDVTELTERAQARH